MSGFTAGWYIRRLRGMSLTEVVYRTLDAGRRRVWVRRQVQPGEAATLPSDARRDRSFDSRLPAKARVGVDPDAATALVRAADSILAGTWTVLGTRRTDSADPDWFYYPVTGRRAPRPTGVQTYPPCERRRPQHQTGLGNVPAPPGHGAGDRAAKQEERYAEAAAEQLRSWWMANPSQTGVHWTSGIEAGVRLIAWAWTRRLLDEWPKVSDLFEDNDDALAQIAWHQEFLAAFRSRGSSANNHVIAEAAGQLVAACAFPWYGRSDRWRRSAAALLERELAANTFDDGLNRELATDYHRFVLELAMVAAEEADVLDHALSEATWERLARMLDVAAAITDSSGRPPRQNDGDEGRALVVDDPERDPWATILATCTAPPGPAPGWWPPVAGAVQASLLGALGGSHEVQRLDVRPRRFPDAGLVLLRSRPEDGQESGAGAMAAHTGSCLLRRMRMPTLCRWRCGTTVSTSSPTPAHTATTASRHGENGSVRPLPTTPWRSAG